MNKCLSASARDTRGYMLCKMWNRWGIDKPCVFWMSSSTTGLGSLKDTIKSRYFSKKLSLHKHGSSLLESFLADWSSVCMDIMVHLKMKKIIKFFINLDINPRKMLKLAETKSTLWADAQILNKQNIVPHVESTTLPSILGRWCFTYGSWKENDIFSGQGWLSTLERFDGLMGEKNVHASLSLLRAEMEALLWTMECMRNLHQLVKMVLEPEEWPAFTRYLEDIKILKESFLQSKIIYVPRMQNSKADSLAHNIRKQPSFVVQMDQDLPFWFTESVWNYIIWCQKKNYFSKFFDSII